MISLIDFIISYGEVAGIFLSLCSVLIIVVGLLVSLSNYWLRFWKIPFSENFNKLKLRLARVLIIALEILVVADIIETVIFELTFESLLRLGLLVIARTWLSWTLELESEGHWPWQLARKEELNDV